MSNDIKKLNEKAKAIFSEEEIHYHNLLFSRFTLEDDLIEIGYINKIKNDKWLLAAYQKNISKAFRQTIRKRIKSCDGKGKNNNNFNLVYFGTQFKGKSTAAVATYLMYYDDHSKFWNRFPDLTFSDNDSDLLSKLSFMKNFDLNISDEDHYTKGSGSLQDKHQLFNLIAGGRFTGKSIFKLCPDRKELVGCDYALLMAGIDKKGKEYYKRTGDASKCITRCIVYSRDRERQDFWKPDGFILLPVGRAMKFMEKIHYEEMKEEKFRILEKNLGGKGTLTEEKKQYYHNLAKELLDYAISEGWDGKYKSDLDAYLFLTESALRDDEKNAVKTLCRGMFLRKNKKKEEIEEMEEEEINLPEINEITNADKMEDDSFAAFVYNFIISLDFEKIDISQKKSLTKLQLAEFLRSMENGSSIMDLYYAYKKWGIAQHDIKAIQREYQQNGINGENIFRDGFLAEQWFGYWYDGSQGTFGGNQQHEIDYFASDQEIFTIKKYNKDVKSEGFSQRKDFHPSFQKAYDENRTYWRVYINNKFGYPNCRIYKTDPRGDDHVHVWKDIKQEECFTHPKQVWNFLHPDDDELEDLDLENIQEME